MTPIVESKKQTSAESQMSSSLFRCISQQAYTLGSVQVMCWLCEGIIPDLQSYDGQDGYTHSVGLYSLQNGLVCLDFKSALEAREVFSLMTRYEVSPYHAEDVLEDREIAVRIRYL